MDPLLLIHQRERHIGNNPRSNFLDVKTLNGRHQRHETCHSAVNEGVLQSSCECRDEYLALGVIA